jgi:hypothetical protein
MLRVMWRRVVTVCLGAVVGVACAAPQSVQPTQAPTTAGQATQPTVAATTQAAQPTVAATLEATATPRPAVQPTATAVAQGVVALPTIESTAVTGGPGFLTPIEINLEFAQPVTNVADLRKVVDGVQGLEGVAYVHSDGVHIAVRYDTTMVLPDRIRSRLRELGFPAKAGTDVQNPGDAAD